MSIQVWENWSRNVRSEKDHRKQHTILWWIIIRFQNGHSSWSTCTTNRNRLKMKDKRKTLKIHDLIDWLIDLKK